MEAGRAQATAITITTRDGALEVTAAEDMEGIMEAMEVVEEEAVMEVVVAAAAAAKRRREVGLQLYDGYGQRRCPETDTT